MSGKHVRVRAWLPGGGGLALTVAVAAFSWLAIALFLVLPGSAPTDPRGPAEAGATPAGSITADDPRRQRPDALEDPVSSPASSSAGQRPAGSGATGPDVTAASSAGGGAEQAASGHDGSAEVGPSDAGVQATGPRADPPGKAKGHDKDRDRGPH